MSGRVFIFLTLFLTILVIATRPAVWRPLLEQPLIPTATLVAATPTASPTATRDPFAHVPTATPLGRQGALTIAQALPSPALGALPPTYTATPAGPSQPPFLLPAVATASLFTPSLRLEDLVIPTPVGAAPDRLQIPRLKLDAPVEVVGLTPSSIGEGVFEWTVPDHRAAGWLNTSAPFGRPGNTVLDGHHNIMGEVFKDLWTLRPGDEIRLWAGSASYLYRVKDVLILPERDQPLEVRLANAVYIQPTEDERLTLITCWPYNDNTHRTVVVALPAD